MPVIHEHYKQYVAPRWFRPTVERLLASLEPEHVSGVESVVLTDGASIGKGKTHRIGKRKYRRSNCLGFYRRASRTGRPWIELVADNIVPTIPRQLLWLQLFRDVCVANTLYHEVGHHLEHTVGAATRRGETAADDWCKRLTRIHFRKRYRYVVPVLKLLLRLLRSIIKLPRTPANE